MMIHFHYPDTDICINKCFFSLSGISLQFYKEYIYTKNEREKSKMKKRILCIAAAISLLSVYGVQTFGQSATDGVLRTSITAFAETSKGDYEFDKSTGTITKYNGTSKYVSIPSSIDGVPVTTIGASSFKELDITNVSIPSTVTAIEDSAFSDCRLLEKVFIPDSVTKIEIYAFLNCFKLQSVTIPASVTELGYGVFSNCTMLNSVIFDENSKLETLPGLAFNDTSLSKISLPDSIKTIGSGAFSSAPLLSVHLPASLEVIESFAFNKCSFESIVIPDSVSSIGYYAFNENNNLKTICYKASKNAWNAIDKESGCIPVNTKIEYLYESPHVVSYSLVLDGTLNLAVKFSEDIKESDNYTIGDQKLVTQNSIVYYPVAPRLSKNNIIIAHNGKEINTLNVIDILAYYKTYENTTEIASALQAYCLSAVDYFNNEQTVFDYSESFDSIKKAIGPHNVQMGDNYYGSSLVLKSSTLLRHYYTTKIAGSTEKDGLYYIDESVPAHLYTNKVKYCVNDYIYLALSNESTDIKLKNLCAALYNYGVAAENYKKANG